MIGLVTQQAIDAQNAAVTGKAYADRGIAEGPGKPMAPSRPPQPQQYARPYLTDGHAADSPGNDSAPVQHLTPSWRAGVHGDGPIAQYMRDWQPRAAAVTPGERTRP